MKLLLKIIAILILVAGFVYILVAIIASLNSESIISQIIDEMNVVPKEGLRAEMEFNALKNNLLTAIFGILLCFTGGYLYKKIKGKNGVRP